MADARIDYRLRQQTWGAEDATAASRFHATKAPDDKRAWIDLEADEQGVYREKAAGFGQD